MVRICRIGFLLLFFLTSLLFAGDEAAWKVLDTVQPVDARLRLTFSSHRGEVFKGCSKLVVDLEKYDIFKWDYVAQALGYIRPEKKETMEVLLIKLKELIGKPVYIAERSSLKKTADCHYFSDAAVLDEDSLFLYFELFSTL